ncbi:hypothetical protein GMRT_16358 [Giardia muris]|uniref:Uncharacterized protein n=1 Tax=Giardia muris TaxID=5742 RepID=A0A4Z1SY20_GIAMU|nr:hypothetical protein GMRT_16358 [Giardia muris]|eukprot:TNJ29705.1 hypothetical protein GMRT_16358 [Giardia muris]
MDDPVSTIRDGYGFPEERIRAAISVVGEDIDMILDYLQEQDEEMASAPASAEPAPFVRGTPELSFRDLSKNPEDIVSGREDLAEKRRRAELEEFQRSRKMERAMREQAQDRIAMEMEARRAEAIEQKRIYEQQREEMKALKSTCNNAKREDILSSAEDVCEVREEKPEKGTIQVKAVWVSSRSYKVISVKITDSAETLFEKLGLTERDFIWIPARCQKLIRQQAATKTIQEVGLTTNAMIHVRV